MTTEWEKCLNGDLYDAHDATFKTHKQQAYTFLKSYNQTAYDHGDERHDLLTRYLGGIGHDATIGTPFLCDMAANIYLGSKVSVNMNCSFMDSNLITIDDETMIGPNVQIYTATHPVTVAERLNSNWDAHPEQHFVRTRALPVHIEHQCWLGGGVIVLPGVTIGAGSVIGGGSVVTHDIPAGVVAVGNPCRVVKTLIQKA